MKRKTRYAVSGVLAGVVNGLFGGGGGMVLVPLLRRWCGLEERKAFATCVAVILPLCVVSAAVYVLRRGVDAALAAQQNCDLLHNDLPLHNIRPVRPPAIP